MQCKASFQKIWGCIIGTNLNYSSGLLQWYKLGCTTLTSATAEVQTFVTAVGQTWELWIQITDRLGYGKTLYIRFDQGSARRYGDS